VATKNSRKTDSDVSYPGGATRASRINADHLKRRSARPKCQSFRTPPPVEFVFEPAPVTPFGGLTLAARLIARLKLRRSINGRVQVFENTRGYDEATHVLTHAYNLFLGGSCIEDIAKMQADEGVKRIVGADEIPDPTTAGDFLRRLDPESQEELNRAIDEAHEQVWRQRNGRRKAAWAVVDLDSHVRPVYGAKKVGADFSYKGSFAYHPLVISLAGTQEVLRLVNRSGNTTSADDAHEHLEDVLPMIQRHHHQVLVRGDSAFFSQKMIDVCEEASAYFALVVPGYRNLKELAESLDEDAWTPFETKAARERKKHAKGKKRRRKRPDVRRKRARARGKRDLKLKKQALAEVSYKTARSNREYRLIIRRRIIEESSQLALIDRVDYRFAITNLPKSHSAEQVIDHTYGRCDQENVIEQLQNGVAAMRMPTGSLLANAAYMICARLAFNLKSWLAQLRVVPGEVMRWEWKRFRYNFVIIAATVLKHARALRMKLHSTHAGVTRMGRAYQALLR